MKRTVVITILVLLFMFSSVSINYAETVNEILEENELTEEKNLDDDNILNEDINMDTNIDNNVDTNVSADIDKDINLDSAISEEKEIEEIEKTSITNSQIKVVEQKESEVPEKNLIWINNQWRIQINGQIDYDYEGMATNENGTWYVKDGTIDCLYDGTYYEGNTAYIVEGNKLYLTVPKDTTKVVWVNGKWRMAINGKVDYSYTGIGENENGKWYVKNGIVDCKQNGLVKDSTGDYILKESKIEDKTELIWIENKWRMLVHGRIDYDFEGMATNENGTWYVKDGTIDCKYDGTYYEGDTAYIVEGNKLYLTVPKDTTRVVLVNGNWRMAINGKVDYSYTGVGENENGKWYVKNGIVDCKQNGLVKDSTGDYILKESKIEDRTELIWIENKWRMLVHGRIDYDFEGIATNENGTWYVKDGTIDCLYDGTYYEGDTAYIVEGNKLYAKVPRDTTRVVWVNNNWRMVINGKVDYSYTGVGENENGKWYVKNGIVDCKQNGLVKDSTGDYILKESKIEDRTELIWIENKWRMLVHGKIDYDFEGMATNENGTWYVKDGTIDCKYDGTYYEGDTAYIVEGNKLYLTVPKDTTRVVLVNGNWRMAINGKVDYNYTGIGENENGKWYVKDGIIDFKYNSECTDENGIVYNIVNNELRDIMKVPGYPATMFLSGPNSGVKYLSDAISVEGWALSLEKNDKILIYIDGKYVGEATREQNEEAFLKDTNNEFGGNDSNPLPGFYFDLTSLKLKVGNHKLKVVNVASDGKTIMQTREIDFNIFALTKSKGIDVSNHQGIIDWNAVKNSGVTFAIIKIGEYWPNAKKFNPDRYFERNYSECRRLGIAVGGYVYTYAFNSAEATLDAKACLDKIVGKRFDLPIYYDIEDPSIVSAVERGETNANMLTDAVLTFCNIIKNAGYQSGVYTYLNFFENFLNAPLLEKYCSIWVAQWGSHNDYKGKYDFWQYSSNGSVPGINGRVDLDWYYPKK